MSDLTALSLILLAAVQLFFIKVIVSRYNFMAFAVLNFRNEQISADVCFHVQARNEAALRRQNAVRSISSPQTDFLLKYGYLAERGSGISGALPGQQASSSGTN